MPSKTLRIPQWYYKYTKYFPISKELFSVYVAATENSRLFFREFKECREYKEFSDFKEFKECKVYRDLCLVLNLQVH